MEFRIVWKISDYKDRNREYLRKSVEIINFEEKYCNDRTHAQIDRRKCNMLRKEKERDRKKFKES